MNNKKKLIAGNWKMNGSLAANEALLKALIAGAADVACDVAVAVPAPYLAQVQALTAGTAIAVAAQDVSSHETGAYTGEVSVAMLKLDQIWDNLFPAEQTRIVKLLIEKIVISRTGMEVRLRPTGIDSLTRELSRADDEQEVAA